MALADFTDLASVKAYGGITSAGDDTMLTSIITGMSAAIRTMCSRDITSNDYDIRRSGRGTLALQMPQYPITAVTLLEIDGRAVPQQSAWGAPGFYFDDEQIALVGHAFTRGISNVHVQFSAGYATPPADLAQACNELVTLRYKLRDKIEWSSKTLAGETVSLVQKAAPDWVKAIIANYSLIAPL